MGYLSAGGNFTPPPFPPPVIPPMYSSCTQCWLPSFLKPRLMSESKGLVGTNASDSQAKATKWPGDPVASDNIIPPKCFSACGPDSSCYFLRQGANFFLKFFLLQGANFILESAATFPKQWQPSKRRDLTTTDGKHCLMAPLFCLFNETKRGQIPVFLIDFSKGRVLFKDREEQCGNCSLTMWIIFRQSPENLG